jgi:adenylate cyclase
LLLTTPEGQQVVELAAHNSLGRHPTNSVQLLDKIVSKEHCIIEQRGSQFWLRDLGSLNGTYVNGERVSGERPLNNGDDIALGSTRARFEHVVSAPAQARPAPGPSGGYAQVPPGRPMQVQPTAPIQQVPHLATQPFPARPQQGFAPAPAAPGGFQPRPAIVPSGVVGAAAGPGAFARPAAPGPLNRTRVDVSDANRSIGTQINATQKGFLPYDQLATNQQQLAADYERLRLSHELSREICLERELSTLLNKILIQVFKFIRADRGCIFLMDEKGELQPGASLRRDGSDAPIRVSSTIMSHVIKERATVLTHDAAMDFAGSKGRSMILNRISSAIVAPLLHNDDILGVLWLDSETLAQFQQKDLELVTSIAAQAAMFIEINILGKKVEQEIVARERFSRLLSPNVAEKVLSGEMTIIRGGQLVNTCTVFNSDIRGFTRMSDGADPAHIVEILNDYFELMVETIFKYDGTLDKFMGDGIMALWGAPVQTDDDALRCVMCALEQMEALEQFNKSPLIQKHGIPLEIGIGVHTGPVVAGYIGSSKALSYTVIGDTANTSARLCGVAQPGEIIVSEGTLQSLGGKFETKELPPANLKGKEKPFKMFQILRSAPNVQVLAALTH